MTLAKPHFYSNFRIAMGSHARRTFFLVEPLTYMNRSGEILKSVLKASSAKKEELVVIYDNLDLPLGACKLKTSGSSGGHKGLESIFAQAGTQDIIRLGIGIGRPGRRGGVVDHVLGQPTMEEQKVLDESITRVVEHALLLLTQPVDRVMNLVNRRTQDDSSKD